MQVDFFGLCHLASGDVCGGFCFCSWIWLADTSLCNMLVNTRSHKTAVAFWRDCSLAGVVRGETDWYLSKLTSRFIFSKLYHCCCHLVFLSQGALVGIPPASSLFQVQDNTTSCWWPYIPKPILPGVGEIVYCVHLCTKTSNSIDQLSFVALIFLVIRLN